MLICLLSNEEISISRIVNSNLFHHLTDNNLNMFVIKRNALQPVYFLYFVHQITLQSLWAKNVEHIMRIYCTAHQGFACINPIALTNTHMLALWDKILSGLRASLNSNYTHALVKSPKFNNAFNFTDNSMVFRFPCLKEFCHSGKTTSDVFGFSSFSGDFCNHIARHDLITTVNKQVCI